MLEIGAGLNPVVRYLSDFSDQEREKIHLSDLSADTISELKGMFPSNRALQLDLTFLASKIQKDSYQSVIGMHVLDVLITEDLIIACKEIYSILKPGGVFLHFCPLNAFLSPAIDERIAQDRILFPVISDEIYYSGLYIVEKDDFFSTLECKKSELPDWIISPLEKYATLTSAEREVFCETKHTDWNLEQLISLSRCFERLECKTAKKISIEKAFEKRVRLALEGAGFEIVAFGDEQSEVCVQHPWQEEGFWMNRYFLDRGKSKANFVGILAPNIIQQAVNMLVIVAKKPE